MARNPFFTQQVDYTPDDYSGYIDFYGGALDSDIDVQVIDEPEEKEEPVEKEDSVEEPVETKKSMTSSESTPVAKGVTTTPPILTKAALIEQLKKLADMDPNLEVQIITGDEERRKYKKNVEKDDEKTGKYPVFYNQLRNFIE